MGFSPKATQPGALGSTHPPVPVPAAPGGDQCCGAGPEAASLPLLQRLIQLVGEALSRPRHLTPELLEAGPLL